MIKISRKIVLPLSALTIYLFTASTAIANPNDPLSIDEIARVTSLSLPQSESQQENQAATHQRSQPSFMPRFRIARTATDAVDSNPQKKIEVLLVERHQEEKGATKSLRRADIFSYDYSSNELITSLIDLNTQQVIHSSRKQGIQLPLTENEIKRAKQIVFDDEDERQILEYEYHRITSKTLSNTDELNIKAFVFTADSLPNRVNEASKLCGIHRCAQLMLYTGDNIVFEINPIVNLSESIVTQRIGF